MLAGVPLLRTRKHGRGHLGAAQPGSYLAAGAKLAVVLLICTNLVRMLPPLRPRQSSHV